MASSRRSGRKRGRGVERQRQPEVAVEAALVDLVEQHRRDAGELGIGLDAVEEDAFGQDEDPGALPTLLSSRVA